MFHTSTIYERPPAGETAEEPAAQTQFVRRGDGPNVLEPLSNSRSKVELRPEAPSMSRVHSGIALL